MNKDIVQVLKFTNGLKGQIYHKFKYSEDGISGDEAYLQITSHGKKEGFTNDLNRLEFLLCGKYNRDIDKKMWTEDLRNGLLGVGELEGYEDVAYDCMKDIIKTSDRLSEIERLGYPCATIAMMNRNWFMDKLNVKLPEDAHDCYTCKEAFWKRGNYVKNDEKNSSN